MKSQVIKIYYENGKIKEEYHYLNDVLHREDGPAVIMYNIEGNVKIKQYALNGVEICNKNHIQEIENKNIKKENNEIKQNEVENNKIEDSETEDSKNSLYKVYFKAKMNVVANSPEKAKEIVKDINKEIWNSGEYSIDVILCLEKISLIEEFVISNIKFFNWDTISSLLDIFLHKKEWYLSKVELVTLYSHCKLLYHIKKGD